MKEQHGMNMPVQQMTLSFYHTMKTTYKHTYKHSKGSSTTWPSNAIRAVICINKCQCLSFLFLSSLLLLFPTSSVTFRWVWCPKSPFIITAKIITVHFLLSLTLSKHKFLFNRMPMQSLQLYITCCCNWSLQLLIVSFDSIYRYMHQSNLYMPSSRWMWLLQMLWWIHCDCQRSVGGEWLAWFEGSSSWKRKTMSSSENRKKLMSGTCRQNAKPLTSQRNERNASFSFNPYNGHLP